MEKLKAIFYDMDGTLVYFRIDSILARKNAIEELEFHGIPKGQLSTTNPIKDSVEIAKTYMRQYLHYTENKIGEIMHKVNDRVVEIEKIAAENALSVNKIENLLKFAHNYGIKQIIITYNTHNIADLTLRNAGIKSYIDEIYGRDDTSTPKPDPRHIELPAKKYKINPNECLMIGDHKADIDVAKAFGCISIGVKTGGERNDIFHADYIINQEEIAQKVIEIIQQNFVL